MSGLKDTLQQRVQMEIEWYETGVELCTNAQMYFRGPSSRNPKIELRSDSLSAVSFTKMSRF